MPVVHKLDISAKQLRVEVLIDGENIADRIKGYTLRHYAGELPVLTVEFASIPGDINVNMEECVLVEKEKN